jgi:hypothetical protein
MTDQPKRRGGWPGPRRPKWTFRPTPQSEAVVGAYVERHDLDPERGRSQAINALLEQSGSTDGRK